MTWNYPDWLWTACWAPLSLLLVVGIVIAIISTVRDIERITREDKHE